MNKDIITWAKSTFDWNPKGWYQETYLRQFQNTKPRKSNNSQIWVKGRQTGFTELAALAALFTLTEKTIKLRRTVSFLENVLHFFIPQYYIVGANTAVLGPDNDKTKCLFDRAIKFIKSNPELEKNCLIDKQRNTIHYVASSGETTSSLYFASTKQPIARNHRNFIDYLIIDEAAYCSSLKSIVDSKFSQVIIVQSTPNLTTEEGNSNDFTKLAKEASANATLYTCDAYQNPNYTLSIDDDMYNTLGHRTYAKEIQAKLYYDFQEVENYRNAWRESKKTPE